MMNFNKISYIAIDPNSVIQQTEKGLTLKNEKPGFPAININAGIMEILKLMDGTLTINDLIHMLEQALEVTEFEASRKIFSLLEKLGGYICYFDYAQSIRVNCDIEDVACSGKTKLMQLERRKNPQILTFMLSRRCSRQCVYCYANAVYCRGFDESKTFLSLERFKEVLVEAKNIGVEIIELGGGDPFKLENVLEYLRVATSLNFAQLLVSTKEFISPQLAKNIKKIGVQKIQVSLDTYIEKDADRLMGIPGSYVEIVQSIHNLIDQGVGVNVNAVITKMSPPSLVDFINFLVELKVESVSFSLYGAFYGNFDEILFPSLEALALYEEEMLLLRQRTDIIVNYPHINLHNYRVKNNGSKEAKCVYRNYCGALIRRLVIDENGRAIFCSYLPSIEENIVGNLHEQGINDVWNSPRAQSFFLPDRIAYEGTICYECQEFERCWPRRCRMRIYSEHGTFLNYDPYCNNVL